jgi:hypothetical protein
MRRSDGFHNGFDMASLFTRLFSTLEIHFLFFTPQGGAEKSMNEFREGTYTPL